MGEHNLEADFSEERLRSFSRALLSDVRALERLLEGDLVETGVRRIGAEQELFLVDPIGRPAPKAVEVLERIQDDRFTTELARFNLEANLSPQPFAGSCLSDMEAELRELMGKAHMAAVDEGVEVFLTGILPTLTKADLSLDNMTPVPRYYMLNEAMSRARNGRFEFTVKGVDDLSTTHDNVMLEACNTSFQIHFQVGPDEFASLYNLAQAITAPVLAAAVNSPTLLGRRLWHETRVALFQQSVDTRAQSQVQRGSRPRVHFGDNWYKGSVIDLFKDDVARFRVMFGVEIEEDAEELLDQGEIPRLRALCMHNGTIYRWNRACFGVYRGKAHLRIENRILPAGPTQLDEMANAAFFFGLMSALGDEHGDISEVLDFADAKANFVAAARLGLHAQFTWVGGHQHPASSLILNELLPRARQGLLEHGIDAHDATRYLDVIEERVRRGRTGSQWALDSLAGMPASVTLDQKMRTLTIGALRRQESEIPVHEWSLASLQESGGWRHSYQTVGQFMTTDVFTVQPEDIVDLAAHLMDWAHLRHIPVEDSQGRLVGLVSHRALLRLIGMGNEGRSSTITIADIMKRNPVSVGPETPTLEAIDIMRRKKLGCLPIVEGEELVGVISERDLARVATELLERHLREESEDGLE